MTTWFYHVVVLLDDDDVDDRYDDTFDEEDADFALCTSSWVNKMFFLYAHGPFRSIVFPLCLKIILIIVMMVEYIMKIYMKSCFTLISLSCFFLFHMIISFSSSFLFFLVLFGCYCNLTLEQWRCIQLPVAITAPLTYNSFAPRACPSLQVRLNYGNSTRSRQFPTCSILTFTTAVAVGWNGAWGTSSPVVVIW